MSETLEKIQIVSDLLADLEAVDFSHNELGSANGFHDAEDARLGICEYLRGVLERLNTHWEMLNEQVVLENLNSLEALLKKVMANGASIDALVNAGVHNTNFPSQRTNFITAVKNFQTQIKKNFYLLELDLKLSELEVKLADPEFFVSAKSSADDFLVKAEAAEGKIQKILGNLQQKTVQSGIDESAGQFGDLLKHHKDYECYWLVAVVGSACFLCAAVLYVVCFESVPSNGTDSFVHAIQLLKRIFLISIPAIFLRLALTKYNTERGLRIIYGHRGKVLEQYKTFEAGIGDDLEAKNQFRLEIAKYIFSDPQTQYSNHGGSQGTEVNINPIVSAVEKVSSYK